MARAPRGTLLARWSAVRVIFLCAVLAACGGSSDDDADGGDGSPLPADVRGRIEIIEYDGLDAGFVTAHFTDAELTPEVARDGDCRIYQQPCLGQVGACAAPEGFSAGTLDITGLWQPLSLEPGWNQTYYADSVPRDVFASDAEVTASASGDELDPFTLRAGGVAPLESDLAGADVDPLGDGPATFSWTAGGGDARVRLKINAADVCHAGAHWLVLECDADDTGSLEVTPAILAAIPEGYYGCGGSLSRYRSDVLRDGEVDIELLVASADWFNLWEIR
jgi:hypothetical protein